ncbi:hypothetical protein Tco_0946925 [Tanacetum coccineum]
MGSSPFWNTGTIRPESCWEIEGWMMMENKRCDKVNHTVKMDMLKLAVEVECFGKCVDEFDKVTVLFGEMQLKCSKSLSEHVNLNLNLLPNDPIWLYNVDSTRAKISVGRPWRYDINYFDVTRPGLSNDLHVKGEAQYFLKSCYNHPLD